MATLTKSPIRRSSYRQPAWVNKFFRNDFLDLWDADNAMETIPSVNISENKDNYKIEVAAPGLKKEDFSIDVDGNLLNISCEKESEIKDENEKENYYHREYSYSRFSRSLNLPEDADANRIAAKYTDGVLNLHIPKKAEADKHKGQKIKVE